MDDNPTVDTAQTDPAIDAVLAAARTMMLRELAEAGPEAVTTIRRIATSSARDRERLAAATYVVDRLLGRPGQEIAVSLHQDELSPLRDLSAEQLMALLALMAESRPVPPPAPRVIEHGRVADMVPLAELSWETDTAEMVRMSGQPPSPLVLPDTDLDPPAR